MRYVLSKVTKKIDYATPRREGRAGAYEAAKPGGEMRAGRGEDGDRRGGEARR